YLATRAASRTGSPCPASADGRPPSYAAATASRDDKANREDGEDRAANAGSVSHPRIAVALGVGRHWLAPLQACRALSVAPASWWGLRCALTLLTELVLIDGDAAATWEVEKRFRVTEVFLLLNYTPTATIIRLLSVNAINAYITSWVLYLSGWTHDTRLLLPAWIAIASTLTVLYHMTNITSNITKETSASISVFSIASFISMCALLLQLHLTREPQTEALAPLVVLCKHMARVALDWVGPLRDHRAGLPTPATNTGLGLGLGVAGG
ncbi:MAG: hypothetical protein M1838_005182, partial [Thelocarpon superellum]